MCQYRYPGDLLGGWFLPLNFSYRYVRMRIYYVAVVMKTNEIFKRYLPAGSQECICAEGHEIFRAHTYSSAHVFTKCFVLVGTSVQLCSFCGARYSRALFRANGICERSTSHFFLQMSSNKCFSSKLRSSL